MKHLMAGLLAFIVSAATANAASPNGSIVGQPAVPVSFQSWTGTSSAANAYLAGAGPATPVTGTAVSGSCSGITAYVKTTYTGSGAETLPSTETSQVVATNSVLTVTSPAARGGDTTWSVYAATTSGAETLQQSGIAIGTNWQEPNTCLTSGTSPPTSTTNDLGGTSRAYYNPSGCVNQIRPLFTNFYETNAGETNIPSAPGAIVVGWSVEDPNNPGTVLGLGTFNGGSTITIPWNGFAYGDPVELDTCTTKTIWIRTYEVAAASGTYTPVNALLSSQNTYIYPNSQPATIPGYSTTDSTAPGNNYQQKSTSGTGADNRLTTGEAWVTNSSFAKSYAPTAIIGQFAVSTPATPSVCINGDSIAWGLDDQNSGGVGWVVRWLNASGYTGIDMPGSSELMLSETTFANYRVRMSLDALCNDVVVTYGTNDLYTNGESLSTFEGYATAVYTRLTNRGLKVFAATILPQLSCASNCSTIANQTISNPTANANRIAWNTELRKFYTNTAAQNAADPILSKLSGVIDAAAQIEANGANQLTLNGSYLYTGPTGNVAYFGTDGLHPLQIGNYQIATNIPAATTFPF